MQNFRQLHIYLPQSLFRMVGTDYEFSSAVQYQYLIRSPRDEELESDVYGMNRMILTQLGVTENLNIAVNDCFEILNKESLIDMQLLNMAKHFKNLQIQKQIEVVDYASAGHRDLRLTDLNFPVQFSRAFKRNFELWRHYRPIKVYSLIGELIQKNSHLRATPWLSSYIHFDKLKKFAMEFLLNYSDSLGIRSLIESKRSKYLILPYPSRNILETLEELMPFEGTSKQVDVIIKPHRVMPKIDTKTRDKLNSLGIIILDSPIQQILPSELLFLGLNFDRLYSNKSSSYYSLLDYKPISLSSMTLYENRDFGLLAGRTSRII
jgi:hypothetical protein